MKLYLLQFSSSERSPQSTILSQTHLAGMQRPVLLHWNWSSRHATFTNKQRIVIALIIEPTLFCILIQLNDCDKSIRCTSAVNVQNNLCSYNAKWYILVQLLLRMWQLLSCNDVTCSCKLSSWLSLEALSSQKWLSGAVYTYMSQLP